jgi:protease IV
VDSPGGSYVASDTIRREVQRAKEAGKPVVVSMGGLAASGGYLVSMDADRIVAQPGTLTGSIGVFGGKFVTTGLWEKLGVNWDTISLSKSATLNNSDLPYTPEQQARVEAMMDRIYQDFTKRAAAGRGLPLEKLQAVARGRVWTGEDAKALGLVDALGGMSTALQLAKEAAKLPADKDVRVQVFPREKSPSELIAEMLGGGQEDNSEEEVGQVGLSLAPLRHGVRAVSRIAQQLGVGAGAEQRVRAPIVSPE